MEVWASRTLGAIIGKTKFEPRMAIRIATRIHIANYTA